MMTGVVLSTNRYVRTGFLFTGWNTEADGKGKAFSDEDTTNVSQETGRVVLYAQWSPFFGLLVDNRDNENDAPLANAGFTLVDDQDQAFAPANFYTKFDYRHVDDKVPLTAWPLSSNKDGVALLYGLAPGTYYLKQTCPAGYGIMNIQACESAPCDKPNDRLEIAVSEDGTVLLNGSDNQVEDGLVHLTITYQRTGELPSTGFIGLNPLVFIQVLGTVLLAVALSLVAYRRFGSVK